MLKRRQWRTAGEAFGNGATFPVESHIIPYGILNLYVVYAPNVQDATEDVVAHSRGIQSEISEI